MADAAYLPSAAWRARFLAAQPGISFCSGRVSASASGATSLVMHDAAPMMAPSPMVTGATIMVSLPTNTLSPMVVGHFFLPS